MRSFTTFYIPTLISRTALSCHLHPIGSWVAVPLRPSGREQATAIITLDNILETKSLPPGTTCQQADLIALTRVLTLTKGQMVSTHTASKYAFHIIHSHIPIWRERGYLTSKHYPIVNRNLILKLFQEASLPKCVAIIPYKGHQYKRDHNSVGNINQTLRPKC